MMDASYEENRHWFKPLLTENAELMGHGGLLEVEHRHAAFI
jgi:hypothetical protein